MENLEDLWDNSSSVWPSLNKQTNNKAHHRHQKITVNPNQNQTSKKPNPPQHFLRGGKETFFLSISIAGSLCLHYGKKFLQVGNVKVDTLKVMEVQLKDSRKFWRVGKVLGKQHEICYKEIMFFSDWIFRARFRGASLISGPVGQKQTD